MSASRFALVLAAASALATPLAACAATELNPAAAAPLFDPWVSPVSATDAARARTTPGSGDETAMTAVEKSVFLDDAPAAPAPEKPNIHGFIEVPFKTAYVTPRGLVVQDKGINIQPVGGFVFPLGDLGAVKNITFVTGVWNSITTYQHDPNVGAWNEMDYFASFSGKVGDFSGTLTYGAWNFPNSTVFKPKTEHNLDFKLSYDGDNPVGMFHPYADFWWAISGSSTVTFGRMGSTGYIELGVAPSYTFKQITDYPITLAVPTYISVGPRSYWGRGGTIGGLSAAPDGNVGVFQIGPNITVPLAFIPARYGFWHADAGVQYFYLVNRALFHAGTFLTGNNDRNVVVGSIGIGVNF